MGLLKYLPMDGWVVGGGRTHIDPGVGISRARWIFYNLKAGSPECRDISIRAMFYITLKTVNAGGRWVGESGNRDRRAQTGRWS